jgi:hypothetical protein
MSEGAMTSRKHTTNNKVEFVGELPPGRSGNKPDPRWAELAERPGEWAVYWGSHRMPYWTAPRVRHLPGFRFEAARRGGVAYVRAVSTEGE